MLDCLVRSLDDWVLGLCMVMFGDCGMDWCRLVGVCLVGCCLDWGLMCRRCCCVGCSVGVFWGLGSLGVF